PWLSHEDDRVRDLVEARGPKLWAKLAVAFNETLDEKDWRTDRQISCRWRDHLDPNVNRDPFTDGEIEIIRDAQRQMPNKWVSIAKLLPGRTDIQVSTFWDCTIKK
ncbi:hypothetical protein AURANDRAFT_7255, partial [Aureococcus anophagefferens]